MAVTHPFYSVCPQDRPPSMRSAVHPGLVFTSSPPRLPKPPLPFLWFASFRATHFMNYDTLQSLWLCVQCISSFAFVCVGGGCQLAVVWVLFTFLLPYMPSSACNVKLYLNFWRLGEAEVKDFWKFETNCFLVHSVFACHTPTLSSTFFWNTTDNLSSLMKN